MLWLNSMIWGGIFGDLVADRLGGAPWGVRQDARLSTC